MKSHQTIISLWFSYGFPMVFLWFSICWHAIFTKPCQAMRCSADSQAMTMTLSGHGHWAERCRIWWKLPPPTQHTQPTPAWEYNGVAFWVTDYFKTRYGVIWQAVESMNVSYGGFNRKIAEISSVSSIAMFDYRRYITTEPLNPPISVAIGYFLHFERFGEGSSLDSGGAYQCWTVEPLVISMSWLVLPSGKLIYAWNFTMFKG